MGININNLAEVVANWDKTFAIVDFDDSILFDDISNAFRKEYDDLVLVQVTNEYGVGINQAIITDNHTFFTLFNTITNQTLSKSS